MMCIDDFIDTIKLPSEGGNKSLVLANNISTSLYDPNTNLYIYYEPIDLPTVRDHIDFCMKVD